MPGPNRAREKAFADELFRRFQIEPQDWTESERPDCHFRLGDTSVGMEITESTPAEKYWGQDIANKIGSGDPFMPVFYSTSHLRDRGRQRSRDELFQDMFNNPEHVNMAEARQWWCEDVRKAWAKKREKLNEPDYQRFDKNWLLIWDNEGLSDDWSTLTNIQQEVKRTKFFTQGMLEFDHVYVLSGDYNFDFIPGKVSFTHQRSEEVNAWMNPKGEQAVPPKSDRAEVPED